MTLYVNIKTKIEDLKIDYIEINLVSGERVSLNWDFSGKMFTEEGFIERFQGVYFGEEYALDRIDELTSITIIEIGYYTESIDEKDCLEIEEMIFEEGERTCISKINYAEKFRLYYNG